MRNISYTENEKQSFIKYLEQSVNRKEIFKDWQSYAHELVTHIPVDSDKIRMALRSSPVEAMVIIGMPNVFTYKEINDTAIVGFMTKRGFLDTLSYSIKHHETFEFADDYNLERFEIQDWSAIPNELLEHHKAQVSLLYDRVKDSKLADWNKEASTTNNFLKNIIYSNNSMIVQDDIHKIDFFIKEEFEVLENTRGNKYDKHSADDVKLYNYLKKVYKKNQYWANQIKRDLFPNGVEKTVKKPTNQGNNFDGYLWSRIYPSQEDLEVKWLAFTIGISEHHFEVKIDTVGLEDNDAIRQKYFKERGDFYSSELVYRYHFESITGWLDLIRRTKQDIKKLMPHYERLKNLGNESFHSKFSKMNQKYSSSLNQILYGPPGTGKTYATKEKAVRIANPNFFSADLEKSREAILEEYNQLCEEGQIVFTTFHQSLSYEDFVEGIKPIMNGKDLSYQIESGIFKSICEKAENDWQALTKGSEIHLPFDEAFSKLREEWEEDNTIQFSLKTTGNEYTILDFTDTSIHFKKANGGTGHTLSIATLRKAYHGEKKINPTGVGIYYPGIITKLKSYEGNSEISKKPLKSYVLIIDEINRGNVSSIFGELITLLESDKRLGEKEEIKLKLPYSKNSMVDFGVPPNLHIIGTMNTADRSVEALDTALRRRFTFEEIMPQPELLSPAYQYWQLLWEYKDVMWDDSEFKEKEELFFATSGASEELIDNRKTIWSGFEDQGPNQNQVQEFEKYEFNGLRLDRTLQTINSRIEALLDRDHTIGHSYFFKVKDAENKERALKQVFKDSIIPLLQEYFYGDYSRIGLVLGEGFVKQAQRTDEKLFAKFNNLNPSFEVPERYELISIDDSFKIGDAIKQLTINV